MPRALRSAGLAFLAVALPLAGCVTTGGEERPQPKTKLGTQRQPEGVTPGALFVATEYPIDSDANGYVDTINVRVYLFDGSGKTTLSIYLPGDFEFTLQDARGHQVAVWRIPSAKAADALQLMDAGPSFSFRLSLLDFGTDKLDTPSVVLTSVFFPVGGAPIRSTGGNAFRLGRGM